MELEVEPAEVMLVIDRSGSMLQPTSDGSLPWTRLVQTMEQLLPQLDGIAHVGLAMFPAADLRSQAEACRANTRPDVTTNADWRSTLRAIQGATPGGGTPTFEGMRAGYQGFATQPNGSRRFSVLVTDGGAACNPTLDTSTCVCLAGTSDVCQSLGPGRGRACLDSARIVTLATEQREAGIETAVVGLVSPELTTPEIEREIRRSLDQIAVAGGTGAAFQSSTATELATQIAASVLPTLFCRFRSRQGLDESVALSSGTQRIAFDGTRRTGWAWRSDARAEVALHGDSCTQAIRSRITTWRATRPGRCYAAE